MHYFLMLVAQNEIFIIYLFLYFILWQKSLAVCLLKYLADIRYHTVHAAILQVPAVNKKMPPKSGYRRTKINRKRFHLLSWKSW